MLNTEQLGILRSILDENSFKSLIDLYEKDSSEFIRSCEESLKEQNWGELSSLAHGLKGCSLNLGVEQIANFSKSLEFSAKEQDYEACAQFLKKIQDEQVVALKELRIFKDEGTLGNT